MKCPKCNTNGLIQEEISYNKFHRKTYWCPKCNKEFDIIKPLRENK